MVERHAAQAPALRERHPQIVIFQSSIFNLLGFGLSAAHWRVYPV